MYKKISLIVVSAGKGVRFDDEIPKQYCKFKNQKTILEYTLEKFIRLDCFSEYLVVINKAHLQFYEKFVKKSVRKYYKIIFGGKERKDSVYNALVNCSKNTNIVIIHDGVRPFFSKELVLKVINNTLKYDACVPVLPLRDTIKKVKNGFVEKTIPRDELFAVQTPQGFNYKKLLSAYEKWKHLNLTDEAWFFEKENLPVKIIKGELNNIKITYKEDMIFGEYLYEKSKLSPGRDRI